MTDKESNMKKDEYATLGNLPATTVFAVDETGWMYSKHTDGPDGSTRAFVLNGNFTGASAYFPSNYLVKVLGRMH